MLPPPPLKPDSSSQANFQALNAQLGDSCSAPILEPERSALIQEALADSQLQAVKAQLEGRGLGMNVDEAQAVQLVGGVQLLIPFGQDAHLVWTRTNGRTAAIGLVRQGNKTLNVGGDGQERVVRFLSAQQAEKLLRKLREKSKFQDFEGKLAQRGKRVGRVRVLLDETNKLAILGIAAEGNEEKISHQVRIKVKANKDDEPEDDAEPAIQATACGQASGEAVALGARLQPLALDPGEGGDVTTGSYDIPEGRDYGPQICTSQWGYDYLCLSRTPSVSLSTTSLALPQTFINQQVQASFVIWNGGGGTLTGTVSVPAPFSIVSGGSFSLLPGQPQEVVVRFSSGTAGSFSKSITISSNGGNATVTATGVAHKVSFSPAPLDFGSGLLVMREQCDDTGGCKLRTEKVGLPIEKQLTVKNEGTVAVSLTLSTAAPYRVVSVLPTLSPGQSAQVTLRFDPSESGSFSGTVQVGISEGQGSVTAPPLVGVAHKIEVSPPQIGFGLLLLSDSSEPTYKEQQLTVKNQGVTTVSVTASVSEPFRIVTGNSFTLAPAASSEVTVRFDPPAPGEFQGAVKLTVGQLTIEIPAKASAMKEHDFLQMLAELSQIQELDTIIPTMGNVDVALLGFQNVSASELQTLLEWAKNQSMGSLIPQIEPDQTGNWVLDFLIGYIVGKAIDLLVNRAGGFNIIDVTQTLFDPFTGLIRSLQNGTFDGDYKMAKKQSSFGQFVNALESILAKMGSQGVNFFGASDAEIAARNIIANIVHLYMTSDGATQGKILSIIQHFGPVAAFLLGGLIFADPGRQTGILDLVLTNLNDILKSVGGKPWYDYGTQLWYQLVNAIAILGSAMVYQQDSKVWKQASEILMALTITGDMARNKGWDILGFRAYLCLGIGCNFPSSDPRNTPIMTKVDVVASTMLSNGKGVIIFGQFFHAVTKFSSTDLQRLIEWVQGYAQLNLSARARRLSGHFGWDTDFSRIAGYTPGIVVAVNSKVDSDNNGKTDLDEATSLITNKVNECNRCFFGVVIVIDPDKEEVTSIIGIGISQEEAIEIAARMGIYIGSKWSIDQLRLWLMGMLMK